MESQIPIRISAPLAARSSISSRRAPSTGYMQVPNSQSLTLANCYTLFPDHLPGPRPPPVVGSNRGLPAGRRVDSCSWGLSFVSVHPMILLAQSHRNIQLHTSFVRSVRTGLVISRLFVSPRPKYHFRPHFHRLPSTSFYLSFPSFCSTARARPCLHQDASI